MYPLEGLLFRLAPPGGGRRGGGGGPGAPPRGGGGAWRGAVVAGHATTAAEAAFLGAVEADFEAELARLLEDEPFTARMLAAGEER